jgi:energy-coupling factor transporter ATP-binding protein EcfA2
MNLQLKRFDPSKIASDKVILFIGKRGSGKSTLVMDIMYHKRNIPTGVVMSATEDGNHFYKQYIPDLFIYGCYNKETIENIIQRQSYNINKYGSTNNVFILLDDLMFDKSFLKDDCIRTLFMNGRHYKIFLLITMQHGLGLPPDLRSNIDYVFTKAKN